MDTGNRPGWRPTPAAPAERDVVVLPADQFDALMEDVEKSAVPALERLAARPRRYQSEDTGPGDGGQS